MMVPLRWSHPILNTNGRGPITHACYNDVSPDEGHATGSTFTFHLQEKSREWRLRIKAQKRPLMMCLWKETNGGPHRKEQAKMQNETHDAAQASSPLCKERQFNVRCSTDARRKILKNEFLANLATLWRVGWQLSGKSADLLVHDN